MVGGLYRPNLIVDAASRPINFTRKRSAGFYHSIRRRTFCSDVTQILVSHTALFENRHRAQPSKTHVFETFSFLYQVYSFVLTIVSHSAKAVVVQKRSVSGAKIRGEPQGETVDGMVV